MNAKNSDYLPKFLVVTGGTISGIGKGTILSSIGVVLKSMGFVVTAIKIDPYINIDAGNMSPFEHGEVFVLSDGGEVDLDLGNYERFLGIELTKDHNITTGKIYDHVIRKERKGDYLGKTVQVVPHITDAIIEWIKRVSKIPVNNKIADICLIEVGGTVGDIESSIYLEALRQFSNDHRDSVCFCHVSYVPAIGSGEHLEQKTKPTQHGVKELLKTGIYPMFIFCRSEKPLNESSRDKIALFCQVSKYFIISISEMKNSYCVPLIIQEQNFGTYFCSEMQLVPRISLSDVDRENHLLKYWEKLYRPLSNCKEIIKIGVVGKYTNCLDAYFSIIKGLEHAAVALNAKVEINWIDSHSFVQNDTKTRYFFENSHGILCPGGFGDRGIEGKIEATRRCREENRPFFGICLGLQIAVIEYARNVLGLSDANSSEFDPNSTNHVITDLPDFDNTIKGGTMRRGSYKIIINDPNSIVYSLYNEYEIFERHRHRFEVNPKYIDALKAKGMKFSGFAEDKIRVEVVELENAKSFFLATQFHPEFKSKAVNPAPCFLGFVAAAKKYRDEVSSKNVSLSQMKEDFYTPYHCEEI